MIRTLDSLSVRIRSIPFFWRLTLLTRILLAAGFIPTGMVKLLGQRFTLIPDDTPIGALTLRVFGLKRAPSHGRRDDRNIEVATQGRPTSHDDTRCDR